MNVDWTNDESHLLVNPRWPKSLLLQSKFVYDQVAHLPGHVWIATSGSTSAKEANFKLVALAKSAFVASANAVNQHLQASDRDRWLLALPTFHVGGLSIFTRAWLTGSEVMTLNTWSPQNFCELAKREKVTLSALVPTQVFDLVESGLPVPGSLRAIVIGGAALRPDLWQRARELGWPLLPSFGMSECCSQIATASLASLQTNEFPKLTILDHIRPHLGENGRLGIQSPALFSGYANMTDGQARFWDPRDAEGIFWSEDFVEIENSMLRPLGRRQDFVKISGELVNIARLNSHFAELCANYQRVGDQAVLVALPDSRLGHRIDLVWEKLRPAQADSLIENFNQSVAPFERILKEHVVDEFPRTPLGKIRQAVLLTQLRVSGSNAGNLE